MDVVRWMFLQFSLPWFFISKITNRRQVDFVFVLAPLEYRSTSVQNFSLCYKSKSSIESRSALCTLSVHAKKKEKKFFIENLGSILGKIRIPTPVLDYVLENSEPVFVNLLRSPGIDSISQPHAGLVRQPYLTYRHAMVHVHKLAESIPWNWFLGSLNVYKYWLWSGSTRSYWTTVLLTCTHRRGTWAWAGLW
jgi:hypothetical protein